MAFLTSASLATAQAAKAAKAAERKALAELVGSYEIRPDSPPGTGWRLRPMDGRGPVWYLADRKQAIKAIPRHRAAYAGPQHDPKKRAVQ